MQKNKSILKFSDAINHALHFSMKKDKHLLCYGLGVTDPKNIFGTTRGLVEKFGNKRVFDVPCSENALTGISIGAALGKVRSVVAHQRLDFFLLAMDQLVNSAAKWYYMFGGQISVPITIRLIIGRGWGQGPTHSQNLQSMFSQIPGIKVCMPTFPEDARDLLIKSILDPNPVIFLEHRWLHDYEHLSLKKVNLEKSISKSNVIKKGKSLTIVANSYLVLEAIKASFFLKKYKNIDAEIIDLISMSPIDYKTIFASIDKTKNLLVLDSGYKTCSVSSQIISEVVMNKKLKLKNKPAQLAMPDIPEPTSYALTKNFYIDYKKIFYKSLSTLKIKINSSKLIFPKNKTHHDQPSQNFNGPF